MLFRSAFVGDGDPWMRWGEALLEHLLARDIPLLAVCFGHQLLGQALESDVGPNPRGREMGTIDVEHDASDDDPLLGGLPRRFEAQCTHRDVIRSAGRRLTVLGRAPHDPCHIVRAGPRAWGLQFHPEFDDVVMRLYLEARLDTPLVPGKAAQAYKELLELDKQCTGLAAAKDVKARIAKEIGRAHV